MASLPVQRRSSLFSEANEWRSPFRNLARFQREMDRMFDDFWGNGARDILPAAAAFQPACDCQETDSHYLFSFDLPGLKKEDVKIELQDNCIHVSGERKREHEEKIKGGYQSERFYGAIDRWLPLPGNVKSEGVEAQMDNGVLQVAIPKSEESKAKPIKIGDGKSGVFSKQLENKAETKAEKKSTAA